MVYCSLLEVEILKKKICLFLLVILLFVLSGCKLDKALFNFNSDLNKNENDDGGMIHSTTLTYVDCFENDITAFSRNNFLNEDEQLIYDVICTGMKEGKTTISLAPLSGSFVSENEMKEELSNAFFSALRDHPEFLMYDNSYTYKYDTDLKMNSVSLELNLAMDSESARAKIKEIDRIVYGIAEKIKDFDEYNKSKYIYTYLAQNTEYTEGENSYNMYGAIVEGKAKCDGYTKAYLYIMQKCGVEAGYICGEGKGDLHAWNIVKIDGDWYYVDCTWGDPVIESDNAELLKDNVDYSYLHVTTAEILASHTFDEMYMNLPEYKENDENYYVKEAFFFEEYNAKILEDVLYDAVKEVNRKNSSVIIEIKYKNYEDAQKAYDWMNGDNIMNVAQKIECSGFSYRKIQSDIGTFSVEIDFEF